MPNCQIDGCGFPAESKAGLKRHYRNKHSGEIETPEEHLPDDNSEQRDFAGEEPSTDGHDPEYVETNDPDTGKFTDLSSFEEEDSDDE